MQRNDNKAQLELELELELLVCYWFNGLNVLNILQEIIDKIICKIHTKKQNPLLNFA